MQVMTTRHKELISDKESMTMKNIVYKGIVKNTRFEKDKINTLKKNKDKFYDYMDDDLDNLFANSLYNFDRIIDDEE
jgi:hypothetical protein